jgi:stringent starvation protein B
MNDGQPPRMTSKRPYLLRALHAWIADNGMTPHLVVDATRPGVQVPPFAVSDGRVVLNVADRAVVGLEMGNELITFTARFGGVSHPVRVPISAVLLIYARETGHAMALPEDAEGVEPELDDATEPPGDDDGGGDTSPTPRRGGHLRIVK